jgi:SAM-dependent methyltransferase
MSWYSTWFDSPYYHQLYAHRDYREADTFVKRLMKYLRLPLGARILDLGCGTGRHSHAMASLGYAVTGIDLSKRNILAATAKSGDAVHFRQGDMREIVEENAFDLVVNLFTSFGYFEKEEDNQKVLNAVFSSLKIDGLFVLDFFCRRHVDKHLVPHEIVERDGQRFEIERFISTQQIHKKITLHGEGENLVFEEVVNGFTPRQLRQLLTSAGFKIIDCLGDYQLNTFDENQSERCIFIGQKKETIF